MNFDQAKALRLQQWRSTLDDHDFRMQNPEAHRETLHSMAATLATESLINQLQLFDMNEMADAAYWHAVEELQNSAVRSSTYDVLKIDKGELLGTISRSIFNEVSVEPTGPTHTYDGKVYTNANGADLVLSMSGEVGRISGLSLVMPDGREYRLIETARIIDGRTYEPLGDSEMYRTLIDVAQVARECRNLTPLKGCAHSLSWPDSVLALPALIASGNEKIAQPVQETGLCKKASISSQLYQSLNETNHM